MNAILECYMIFFPLVMFLMILVLRWVKNEKLMELWFWLFYLGIFLAIGLTFWKDGTVISVCVSTIFVGTLGVLVSKRKNTKFVVLFFSISLMAGIIYLDCMRKRERIDIKETFLDFWQIVKTIDYQNLIDSILKSDWVYQVSVGVVSGILVLCIGDLIHKKYKKNKNDENSNSD